MSGQNVRVLNELMSPWAAQLAPAVFVIGLVIVAFAQAPRTFDDERTRRAVRVAAVALGVFVVLQAAVTAPVARPSALR